MIPVPVMMTVLILPINQCKYTTHHKLLNNKTDYYKNQ